MDSSRRRGLGSLAVAAKGVLRLIGRSVSANCRGCEGKESTIGMGLDEAEKRSTIGGILLATCQPAGVVA